MQNLFGGMTLNGKYTIRDDHCTFKYLRGVLVFTHATSVQISVNIEISVTPEWSSALFADLQSIAFTCTHAHAGWTCN